MSVTTIEIPRRNKIIDLMALEINQVSRLLSSLETQLPIHEAKRRGRPRLHRAPEATAS
jgi:hypothetical protein